MIAYLSKRLLAMVPTLLGITLITFFVISIAPGDPVQAQFQTGGAGAGESGGGGNQDRMADAIKAKQQLLGMMTEHRAVLAWEPGSGAALEPAVALRLDDAWARALATDGSATWIGDERGRISVWRDGALSAQFEAHSAPIAALVLADDFVASSSQTGEIAVHGLDGTERWRRPGDDKAVRGLAIDDGRLFAVSDAGWIAELDPTDGRRAHVLEPHAGGIYAVAAGGGRLYSGGADRELVVVDLGSFEVRARIAEHGGAINAIELSPDGRHLATASDDRAARVFDLTGDAPVLRSTLRGHYKKATTVAFGADGVVHTGSADELVRTFDLDGELRGTAAYNTGRVRDLVVIDGEVLGAGDFWRKVPIWRRYLNWLGRTVTLDFGRSFVDDELVIDKLARALPITVGLNLLAIVIIYAISIPVGIAGAVRRNQLFDNASSIVVFMLYSLPDFWLGTMLIMFLSSSRYLDLFPSGKLSVDDPWQLSFLPWLGDIAWHLVLPIVVLVYGGFASLSRYVRTSMLETLSQDYVRTARAKGLKEPAVIIGHAFRNSLITIITLIGNLLPRMIGGSVIVEYIFSIDGMGKLGFEAILSRDYPVIMAITTFAAVLTLLGILLSDLLYAAADPRVRIEK